MRTTTKGKSIAPFPDRIAVFLFFLVFVLISRWTPVADAYGNSGTWLEVVFGHIKIQQGSASAKSMAVGFNDGTTTAIDNAVESGEKQDVWYNLQGQRVAKPSRGIYIHNGKKVICR